MRTRWSPRGNRVILLLVASNDSAYGRRHHNVRRPLPGAASSAMASSSGLGYSYPCELPPCGPHHRVRESDPAATGGPDGPTYSRWPLACGPPSPQPSFGSALGHGAARESARGAWRRRLREGQDADEISDSLGVAGRQVPRQRQPDDQVRAEWNVIRDQPDASRVRRRWHSRLGVIGRRLVAARAGFACRRLRTPGCGSSPTPAGSRSWLAYQSASRLPVRRVVQPGEIHRYGLTEPRTVRVQAPLAVVALPELDKALEQLVRVERAKINRRRIWGLDSQDLSGGDPVRPCGARVDVPASADTVAKIE
jgi:hypothetical protein